ncbi:fumarylacetoacetate hydrolase family protein [Novosphingobium profundi]|uniref:fumarylacetoacetate hydrolase family protein n=1 Tax=Novosphingobium profundi TaxID=1774954 RepID=UPI001BD9C513|nr:fumarylacetoacetate hydrolase family protein [Novosphingobium profundi]MBT0670467.1 fumarylacetoacetate hydrolase family protein [Novosphingobium profundi]
MKLCLFKSSGDATARLGLMAADGVIDASSLAAGPDGQAVMCSVIDRFDALRPELEALIAQGGALDHAEVTLMAPLPRPGKIVNCLANYWEHAQREARPLNMFLKSPDAVIGPGETVVLPNFTEPYAFMHEAELALVFKGPVKEVREENWRDAIFGYTCFMDITARESGRRTWRNNSWMGKSFDTFAPMGPCIVTADEIPDPNELWVQFWNDGQLRHNYMTDDMEHRVPEIVWWLTQFMTMNTGDVVACGTNHEGLGFVQDGETLRMKIHGIGEFEVGVRDPLGREWERGVYMGEGSTNHEAVRRHRPDATLNPTSN